MRYKAFFTYSVITLFASNVYAAGYKINEQSTSGMGTAYAGRGAIVEDATIVFSNPAGLTQLTKPTVSFGAAYLHGKSEYSDAQATNVLGQAVSGPDNGDFDIGEVVPFGYYAAPINQDWAWGIGLYAPAAIAGNYEEDFVGRNFAQDTELTVINLQPTLAYQVNQELSIGIGFNLSFAEGTLTAFKDLGGICENADAINTAFAPVGLGDVHNPAFCDIQFTYETNDWAFGVNLGLFWQPADSTSIGISYSSELDFTLEGDFEITNTPIIGANAGNANNLLVIAPQLPSIDLTTGLLAATPLATEAATLDLAVPQNLMVSINQILNPLWSIQASIQWTDWSAFSDISIISEQDLGPISDVTDQVNELASPGFIGYIPENWRDTLAAAIGVTHQWSDNIKIKSGLAYDPSPIPSQYRTARIPTEDRLWWTLGANIHLNQDWSLDLAYGYMWMKEATVNEFEFNANNQRFNQASLSSQHHTYVHIVSFQFNYTL